MKQTNIVLEQLRSMGFDPTPADELGYMFRYEGLDLLYIPDEDDEEFLRIVVPNIFEVTDENRADVLEAIQSTALTLKYSKVAIVFQSSVWAIYEHRLCPADDMTELLEHIIRVLDATTFVFHRKVSGDDDIEERNDVAVDDGSDDDAMLEAEIERMFCEVAAEVMDEDAETEK